MGIAVSILLIPERKLDTGRCVRLIFYTLTNLLAEELSELRRAKVLIIKSGTSPFTSAARAVVGGTYALA